MRIGRVGGIAVDIHPTFVLVLGWATWQGWARYRNLAGVGYSTLSISLLFACVLLHELGHAVQARAVRLPVRNLVLLPIGGLVQLEANPAHPWHEVVIALAGPMVNLGLALAFGLGAYLVAPFSLYGWGDYLLFRATPGFHALLLYLLWANLILFFFNMLPAFPMDGGRVVRGALAIFTSYKTATHVAAWLGGVAAFFLALLGVVGWPPAGIAPNPLLAIVGVIVAIGAWQEALYVRRQYALVHLEVGDVAHPPTEVLAPWDPLTRALARRLKGERALPVLVGNRLVGFVAGTDVRRLLRNGAEALTVAHAMRADFPILQPRDTLWVALQEMSAAQIATLPIVQEGVFAGVIDLQDIQDAWRLASRRRANARLESGDAIKW